MEPAGAFSRAGLAMRGAGLSLFAILAFIVLTFAGCGSNAFESLADDSSQEACENQAALDLDSGNYMAVLSSPCAGPMLRGAAYFGLAGYDVTDVIERSVDANNAPDSEARAEIYLTALIGTVTLESMANLGSSSAEYARIHPGEPFFVEADFYRNVIINMVASLAEVKGIIDPDGDGALSACDINSNGHPDEVDAAACALVEASLPGSCALAPVIGASVSSTVSPLTFPGYSTSTYAGLNIQISGAPSLPQCTGSYRQILSSAPAPYVVTTTADVCTGSDGNQWNCPLEAGGSPADLVTDMENGLNAAAATLANTPGAEDSELTRALNELITDACGADGDCTSAELAVYVLGLYL